MWVAWDKLWTAREECRLESELRAKECRLESELWAEANRARDDAVRDAHQRLDWARLEVANLQAVAEECVDAEAVIRFRLEALSERSRFEEAYEPRSRAELA